MLSSRSTAMAAYECTTLLSELSARTTCGKTAMASALLISDRNVVRYFSASALRIGFCITSRKRHSRAKFTTASVRTERHGLTCKPGPRPMVYHPYMRDCRRYISKDICKSGCLNLIAYWSVQSNTCSRGEFAGPARWKDNVTATHLISWRLEVWQDLLLVELAYIYEVVRVRRSHRRCSATHLRQHEPNLDHEN